MKWLLKYDIIIAWVIGWVVVTAAVNSRVVVGVALFALFAPVYWKTHFRQG